MKSTRLLAWLAVFWGAALRIAVYAAGDMVGGTNEPPANPDPQRWVWIQAGAFSMGSPVSEADRQENESPQTQVTIGKGFWMAKHETTQGEYFETMGVNPSHFTGDTNRPVEKVSWKNATNYCAKITVREREAGRLPAGFAYRLPTEAEWEYACRAGTATRYAYGDDPDYGQLGEHAWCSPGSANRTHPVETKKPNAWGLYDMHGNVTEWCLDWYGAFPGGSATNPRGPSEGSYRVIRGGAWNYGGAWRCRSANRDYAWPDTKSNLTGFRPVLAPDR